MSRNRLWHLGLHNSPKPFVEPVSVCDWCQHPTLGKVFCGTFMRYGQTYLFCSYQCRTLYLNAQDERDEWFIQWVSGDE